MNHKNHQALIQTILDCAMACEYCVNAAIMEKGPYDLTRCILLVRDCSDLCFQAIRILKRNSEVEPQILSICDDICKKCFDECKKFEQLEYCMDCAESCESCANACHHHYEMITH